MNTKRLLKLAEFLRTVPVKRFDYTKWVGKDWKGSQNLSCGTTACALGWAVTIPSFRKAGLRFKNSSFENLFGETIMQADIVLRSPKTKRLLTSESLRTAEMFFGLTDDQAVWLFTPQGGESFATPKYVAQKIERFVKGEAAIGHPSY